MKALNTEDKLKLLTECINSCKQIQEKVDNLIKILGYEITNNSLFEVFYRQQEMLTKLTYFVISDGKPNETMNTIDWFLYDCDYGNKPLGFNYTEDGVKKTILVDSIERLLESIELE